MGGAQSGEISIKLQYRSGFCVMTNLSIDLIVLMFTCEKDFDENINFFRSSRKLTLSSRCVDQIHKNNSIGFDIFSSPGSSLPNLAHSLSDSLQQKDKNQKESCDVREVSHFKKCLCINLIDN